MPFEVFNGFFIFSPSVSFFLVFYFLSKLFAFLLNYYEVCASLVRFALYVVIFTYHIHSSDI